MDNYQKALSKAAKLCSGTEKCSYDMYNKLLKFDLSEEEASRAIKYLTDNKFIDDRRFAGFFVKDKFRLNGWGKIKIAYALRQKQIPDEIIEESMHQIDDHDYDELLDRLILNKIKPARDLSNQDVKAKIFRFAAQRGFASEDIYKSIQRLSGNSNAN